MNFQFGANESSAEGANDVLRSKLAQKHVLWSYFDFREEVFNIRELSGKLNIFGNQFREYIYGFSEKGYFYVT